MKLKNRGISTVFGAILFTILAITLASTLFTALYRYNYSVQEGIKTEEERMHERIVLLELRTQTINGTEYITAFNVSNTGSITSRIRAVYIDDQFLYDPSDPNINPDDTYINPKEELWFSLPPGVVYQPTAKMTIVTERGIKSVQFEYILRRGGGSPPSAEQTKFYFGPLMLDFNKFFYTECDQHDGSYDPSAWKPGWSIEIGTGSIAWNITVKNVDDRNITINQFSCFTLVPNDEPSERRPWYIEPPGGSFTQFIPSNDTVNIIYIWKTPKMKQMSPQSIYTTVCRNKVFLTFFGLFHEHDGTTKPYGQTIPFEAVLCVRTGGSIDISASPTIILAGSTMTSTITARVYSKYGNPVANANVTFSTTLGTLSRLWAITDTNGIATTTLYPSALPGTANITATWQGLANSITVIINAIPVASFRESAEKVYTDEVINFNASDSYDADGTIVSYSWDFGDGRTATGVAVSHSYSDNRAYTVTLTVTDDRGATGSAEASKTVLNRAPAASFTESAETVYTYEAIDFNAAQSYDPDGSIASYLWNFGDGATATGVAVSHSYSNNGAYTVTLTVIDNDGAADGATATKTILNRGPTAVFSESAETVLTGEVIYFDASTSNDSDGRIVSYSWTFGDGTNAAGVKVEHAYNNDGLYIVTLTVTDDDGATATISADKTILNQPPIASFTESATTVYTGQVIQLDATSSSDPDGTIVSYFWIFGDGTDASGETADHAYADNGVYTVTLTITDDDGASATSTATKTVLNRDPTASLTENATAVSTGDVISFDASTSYDPDGSIVSYLWTFGDGTDAAGLTVNHAYADDGVYTVTLTVTDNDGAPATATATKTVLNRAPVASFTESATTVFTGEVIYLNASASNDADGTILNYFWNFGDGTDGTGVLVNHAYADNGTYVVTLTVTDDDGAKTSTSSTKTVLNRPPVAIFTESAEAVYTSEAITFNASSSYDPDGTIVTYFWTFGDGANATGKIADHAYTDNGSYTVTLTIGDNDGAQAAASATKTVGNRPPIASFTESAATVFTNEIIYFNASGSYDSDGSVASYFWTFEDGANATGVKVDHAYADDGIYTVTLTVTDNDGGTGTATANKTVLNRPPVALFAENATTVLTGVTIRFNASASYDLDGSLVSYSWDFGDGANATGMVVNHAYTDNGIYTVTTTITDDDGATATKSATKTVLNRPPIANFTESAETVLSDEPIDFNGSQSYDPDGSIVTYFWDFGDGTTATGDAVSHVYSVSGVTIYTVTLTVTDNDGATASVSATKTILPQSGE